MMYIRRHVAVSFLALLALTLMGMLALSTVEPVLSEQAYGPEGSKKSAGALFSSET